LLRASQEGTDYKSAPAKISLCGPVIKKKVSLRKSDNISNNM